MEDFKTWLDTLQVEDPIQEKKPRGKKAVLPEFFDWFTRLGYEEIVDTAQKILFLVSLIEKEEEVEYEESEEIQFFVDYYKRSLPNARRVVIRKLGKSLMMGA